MLERERKRKSLVNKYAKKRELIRNELKSADSLDGIFVLNQKIQKFLLLLLLITHLISTIMIILKP